METHSKALRVQNSNLKKHTAILGHQEGHMHEGVMKHVHHHVARHSYQTWSVLMKTRLQIQHSNSETVIMLQETFHMENGLNHLNRCQTCLEEFTVLCMTTRPQLSILQSHHTINPQETRCRTCLNKNQCMEELSIMTCTHLQAQHISCLHRIRSIQGIVIVNKISISLEQITDYRMNLE